MGGGRALTSGSAAVGGKRNRSWDRHEDVPKHLYSVSRANHDGGRRLVVPPDCGAGLSKVLRPWRSMPHGQPDGSGRWSEKQLCRSRIGVDPWRSDQDLAKTVTVEIRHGSSGAVVTTGIRAVISEAPHGLLLQPLGRAEEEVQWSLIERKNEQVGATIAVCVPRRTRIARVTICIPTDERPRLLRIQPGGPANEQFGPSDPQVEGARAWIGVARFPDRDVSVSVSVGVARGGDRLAETITPSSRGETRIAAQFRWSAGRSGGAPGELEHRSCSRRDDGARCPYEGLGTTISVHILEGYRGSEGLLCAADVTPRGGRSETGGASREHVCNTLGGITEDEIIEAVAVRVSCGNDERIDGLPPIRMVTQTRGRSVVHADGPAAAALPPRDQFIVSVGVHVCSRQGFQDATRIENAPSRGGREAESDPRGASGELVRWRATVGDSRDAGPRDHSRQKQCETRHPIIIGEEGCSPGRQRPGDAATAKSQRK